MKYILAAMCALVVLFMGGCAVVALSAGPFALIPAAVAFFNVLILGALFGWKIRWTPAFYILGVVDIVLALAAVLFSSSMNASDKPIFWLAAAVFGIKGLLTFVYASRQAPVT